MAKTKNETIPDNQQELTEKVTDNVEDTVESVEVEKVETKSSKKPEVKQESAGYDPFGLPPQEREYSKPEVAQGDVPDIPEDNVRIPSAEDIFNEPFEEADTFPDDAENIEEPIPEKPTYERGSYANPEVSDLSPKQKKKSAEVFAITIVNAYEMAHEAGYRWLSLEDDKIQKKIVNNKFNPDLLDVLVPLNADGSENIRFADFIKGYNHQLKETLTLDPDIKSEMTELLTEIALEEGWGLSNKQRLLFLVGTDLLVKAGAAIGMRSTMNEAIKVFSAQLKAPAEQAQQQSKQQPDINEPEEN